MALVYLVKGDDESLARDAVKRLTDRLVGDGDRTLMVDDHPGDEEDIGPLVDAAQTLPFLTDRRVVIGREINRFKAAELAPLVAYLEDPLPSTALILVWASGAVPKSLLSAFKAAGGEQVDTSPGTRAQDRRSWLVAQVQESGLRIDRAGIDLLAGHLGEEAGRLRGVLDALVGTFGPGASVSAGDLRPYLGEAGGVAPWDLTDAVDQANIPQAIELSHRMMRERHPLVVLATLHNHLQRMVALDGAGVSNEKDAAMVLGIKGSTFPAKKALEQGRRLGSAKITQGLKLLAQADLDLRGAKDWPPEFVIEILVARLAFLARR